MLPPGDNPIAVNKYIKLYQEVRRCHITKQSASQVTELRASVLNLKSPTLRMATNKFAVNRVYTLCI
jgi:hypothetical protein